MKNFFLSSIYSL